MPSNCFSLTQGLQYAVAIQSCVMIWISNQQGSISSPSFHRSNLSGPFFIANDGFLDFICFRNPTKTGGFSPTHLKNMHKSNWIISICRDENKKYLKTPPGHLFLRRESGQILSHSHQKKEGPTTNVRKGDHG